MDAISTRILENIKAKAGDLNEPGKLVLVVDTYEKILSRLLKQADKMSTSDCCVKRFKHPPLPGLSEEELKMVPEDEQL